MTPSHWTGGDSAGLAWEMGGQTQEEARQAGRPRPGHGAGGPRGDFQRTQLSDGFHRTPSESPSQRQAACACLLSCPEAERFVTRVPRPPGPTPHFCAVWLSIRTIQVEGVMLAFPFFLLN